MVVHPGLAVVVVLVAAAAGGCEAAEHGGGSSGGIDLAGCDWDLLPTNIDRFNHACCPHSSAVTAAASSAKARLATCRSSELTAPCDLGCAAALFRLTDKCLPVLNALFDGSDGRYNGQAAVFADAKRQCLGSFTLPHLLPEIRSLQARGLCTGAALNQVGETPIEAAKCRDKIPKSGMDPCSALVTSGAYSCKLDLCPNCQMGRQCDKTCGFCHDHAGGSRRRTQIHQSCPLSGIAADAAATNAACCDSAACKNGVPRTCDAKCAVKFVDLHNRCSKVLEETSTPDQVSSTLLPMVSVVCCRQCSLISKFSANAIRL